MTKQAKPIVLLILDGWGERKEKAYNAIKLAKTPTFDQLLTYPHTLLEASGEAVGLPDKQMGNSEVGHLHMGSGRKVPQDLTRIDQAIAHGEFFQNRIFLDAIHLAKKNNKAVHILGLLSPGGVHSRDNQISAMIELTHREGVKKNYLHAILDGRDTPPKSAVHSIEKIISQFKNYNGEGKIASLIGRYYAMDRDKRWERTEKAYDLLTMGNADFIANNAIAGLEMAYDRGETDEFVKPTLIRVENEPKITIDDGDVVIFMNFRADRARQLSHALVDKEFKHFHRKIIPQIAAYVTLTEYAQDLAVKVAFPPLKLVNTLGEYLSTHGLRQLRLAETEKYAHVTYFFNGGHETPFPHEDRLLIPSPKVATYDLKPEMSALEVTQALIDKINNGHYDFIVCNFANPDMLGHTGNEAATIAAIETIDRCVNRIINALKAVGGELIITADHGNAELMYDEKIGQPHTAHTSNLVPFIYVGRKAKIQKDSGALDDVAPTLLYLLGLEVPSEMTGQNLLKLQ